MEQEDQTKNPKPKPTSTAAAASPTVRTRWTPKPEQILILESIFNSGMVNPPKDETIRIRKLLEKFGSVGDANVFYWFQNRRSRSRRRQRQLQAAAGSTSGEPQCGGACAYSEKTAAAGGFIPDLILSEYSGNHCNNSDLFAFSGQANEFQQSPNCFAAGDSSGLQFRQADTITVFINGVATVVGKGLVDVQGMFGYDFVVVHSSGAAVPMNEYGFLAEELQHGESYFLVPRHC